MVKKILPWLLIPLVTAIGASIIRLNQIKAPTSTSVSLLYSLPNGTIQQGKVSGMSVDASGNITFVSNLNVPSVEVTHVASNTPNAYPIPLGRTYCFVTRNIPQAVLEDYTIINGNIVFNDPPQVDDIVQLICF